MMAAEGSSVVAKATIGHYFAPSTIAPSAHQDYVPPCTRQKTTSFLLHGVTPTPLNIVQTTQTLKRAASVRHLPSLQQILFFLQHESLQTTCSEQRLNTFLLNVCFVVALVVQVLMLTEGRAQLYESFISTTSMEHELNYSTSCGYADYVGK